MTAWTNRSHTAPCELLAAGPRPTVEIHEAATAHGYSTATLRRAFRSLAGQANKDGQTRWLWKLPDSPTTSPPPPATVPPAGLPMLSLADLAPTIPFEDAQPPTVT